MFLSEKKGKSARKFSALMQAGKEVGREIIFLVGAAFGYVGMQVTESLLFVIFGLIVFVVCLGLFLWKLKDLRRAYTRFYLIGGNPWKSSLLFFAIGALLVLFATGLDNRAPATLWQEWFGVIGAGLGIIGVASFGRLRGEGSRGLSFS